MTSTPKHFLVAAIGTFVHSMTQPWLGACIPPPTPCYCRATSTFNINSEIHQEFDTRPAYGSFLANRTTLFSTRT